MDKFAENLSLKDTIGKMNELKAQKEKILEAERRRQEQEAEKKAAMKKTEQEETEKASVPPAQSKTPEKKHEETGHMDASAERCNMSNQRNAPAQEHVKHCGQRATTNGAGLTVSVLEISGTPQQIAKIKDYIRFTGASFKEM